MIRRGLFAFVLPFVLISCAREARPAELDTLNTACHYCRMSVSDVHFAAQITAPGVESQFFDDLGCLRNFLKSEAAKLPRGAVVFVADHQTGAWVAASAAVFTRVANVSTPMNGGIIAHADTASRAQDPEAAGGAAVPVSEILGPAAPANGGR